MQDNCAGKDLTGDKLWCWMTGLERLLNCSSSWLSEVLLNAGSWEDVYVLLGHYKCRQLNAKLISESYMSKATGIVKKCCHVSLHSLKQV